jgi:hypothetical protein
MRIKGSGPGMPGILMFSRYELDELFLNTRLWEPLDESDFSVSDETLSAVQDLSFLSRQLGAHVRKEKGTIVLHRLRWNRYPHIVLRRRAQVWTSVHLALRRV